MNISKSIKLFLEHCEFEKNLSDHTILFYNIDLTQYAEFLDKQGTKEIREVDKHIIKKYVQELSKFEPRTVKRKIATTKTYLNFLEFEDYITVNPYRKVKIKIKQPLQLPVVLEFEEIRSLLRLIKASGDQIEDKSSPFFGEKLRDLAIIELLFATGVRVSELCGLTVENINLLSGKVLIHGKGDKQRIVQICNPETLRILNRYYEFYQGQIKSAGFFLSVA